VDEIFVLLGKSLFNQKLYDKAIVYFSKIPEMNYHKWLKVNGDETFE